MRGTLSQSLRCPDQGMDRQSWGLQQAVALRCVHSLPVSYHKLLSLLSWSRFTSLPSRLNSRSLAVRASGDFSEVAPHAAVIGCTLLAWAMMASCEVRPGTGESVCLATAANGRENFM